MPPYNLNNLYLSHQLTHESYLILQLSNDIILILNDVLNIPREVVSHVGLPVVCRAELRLELFKMMLEIITL